MFVLFVSYVMYSFYVRVFFGWILQYTLSTGLKLRASKTINAYYHVPLTNKTTALKSGLSKYIIFFIILRVHKLNMLTK